MLAVGGDDKLSLAPDLDAVALHQLAHAFLAHSNALREQLFSHLWPAVFLLDLGVDGLDVSQQGFIADALVVAPGRLGLSASLRRQCSK